MTYQDDYAKREAADRARMLRTFRFGGTVGGLTLLLVFSGCTVLTHATTIQSGEVGVLNKTFGQGAGVQLQELTPGWHWRGIGERIIKYSTRQKVHPFSDKEQICFADQTGLPMCGDIQATIQVRSDRAADIFAVRRLNFEELIDGPVRNDLRSFLSKETEKVPISCNLNPDTAASGGAPTPTAGTAACTSSLMGSGRQAVLQRAAVNWSTKWDKEGVTITDVQWIGTIRYPSQVTDAILSRTATEQRTLAAKQKKAEAEALGAATVATATAEAEAMRVKGTALRENPQIVEQLYAQRSMGLCPPSTKVCIIGSGAWGLVPEEYKQ